MKKMINKSLYIRSLKELIYPVVIMTSIALAILFMKNNAISYDLSSYFTSSKSYNPSDTSLFFIMLFGSFALSSVSLWFSRDKKKADYVYSLPYTKGQIYASKFAAVFTIQLASSFLIMLFGVIISIGFLGKIAFFSDMFIVLVNAMIGSFVVISAMFASASLTGKALSTTLLAGLFIALPALPFISRMSVVMRMVEVNYSNLYLANDSLYIIPNFWFAISGDYSGFRNVAAILFTLFIGIAYAGVGYYLFKKRSGELTGNHTKNRVLHLLVMSIIPSVTVYWLITTTPIGMGVLTVETKTIVLFLMLALMFAALYEVIVTRTLNKILRCFLVLICSIIFVSGIHFPTAAKTKHDMLGTMDYNDVQSVNLINDTSIAVRMNTNGMVSYGEHLVSSIDITDKEAIKLILSRVDQRHEDGENEGHFNQLVKFNLKSGKSVYKNINFYVYYENGNEYLKSDIDVIFENTPEFYDYIYDVIPQEYVSLVCSEYEQEIFNNQDIMVDIYYTYAEEYSDFNLEEQGRLRHYSDSYLYRRQTLHPDNIEELIGLLCVNGRVDNRDVIDIYKVTRDTEQAANKYMQAANDINFLDFNNMYFDIKDNNMALGSKLNMYVLLYDDEDSGEIIFSLFKYNIQPNVIPAEQEYFIEVMNILLSGDITTPKTDDSFVKVIYYDNILDSEKVVFLPISAGQAEEIARLNDEMNG